MTDKPIRHTFEAKSMDDAMHLLRAAQGAYCFVCRRSAWPKGLIYKNLAVCAPCAPFALARELMNDVDETEAAALRVGIDRAGEYLASIEKFDLRDLSDAELDAFSAHMLCGYSEAMSEAAKKSPPM